MFVVGFGYFPLCDVVTGGLIFAPNALLALLFALTNPGFRDGVSGDISNVLIVGRSGALDELTGLYCRWDFRIYGCRLFCSILFVESQCYSKGCRIIRLAGATALECVTLCPGVWMPPRHSIVSNMVSSFSCYWTETFHHRLFDCF